MSPRAILRRPPSPPSPILISRSSPHATGRWATKIRGRLVYFGPWDDPDGALAKYFEQKDALHAGRVPRPEPAALTVKALVNAVLNEKRAKLDNAELSPRTWATYKQVCDVLIKQFGKPRAVADLGPDDFAALRNAVAKRWGLHRLATLIQYTRSVFKHGYEAGLMAAPTRFGPGFARPSKKTFRLERARQGRSCSPPRRSAPCSARRARRGGRCSCSASTAGTATATWPPSPLSARDLDRARVAFPRPKTGIRRRCPLGPETVQAIRASLSRRPAPTAEAHAGLTFVTKYGGSWGKDTSDTPVSKETAKLLRRLGINGRAGLGFYTLRHVFRTVADESKDQPAVDFIMGHEPPTMASVYRERIRDERLRAVTDHVRAWLRPTTSTPADGQE